MFLCVSCENFSNFEIEKKNVTFLKECKWKIHFFKALKKNKGDLGLTIEIKHEIVEYEEFDIPMLNIIIETDYPSTPIKIYVGGDLFGTNTDSEGTAVCGTSEIRDYTVNVEIADETFEGEIKCSD